jgi:cystathionine gamma-lyase
VAIRSAQLVTNFPLAPISVIFKPRLNLAVLNHLSSFSFIPLRKMSSGDDFKPFPHFATDALHAGQDFKQWNSCAVVPPISLSTTFAQEEPGVHTGYEYSRSGNPTRDVLEKCIAALENGKHCMVFSSGLGATTAITHMLKAGDHIVAMNDLYGGTNRYFRKVAAKFNLETTFVDLTNAENLKGAMKPNTKMVWLETPTNPTMQLVDIKACADIAHTQKDVFVVADNTFMSPYFQRPLDLGADISFHSISKYINGHSDVIMGVAITNSDDLHEQLRFLQNAIGPVPSPFDCYMVNRGIKTLHVRMQAHQKNALACARFLESSPRVEKVLHPGLPAHPQYELGKRQMRGYSGMITFYIKGGEKEAREFLKAIKVFTLAESLGGYESLAEHPGIMTHASIVKEEREALGISDNLIRLSVGIEDMDDLVNDLDQALKIAVP